MEGFIKILLLFAYICYLHSHVELHIQKNFSNPNTQHFISLSFLFTLSYFMFVA
jgi:hypothetical protein